MSLNAFAHNGTVVGKITEGKSISGIVGASVFVDNIGTYSDENGNFRLSNIPNGSHKIRVSALGFLGQEKEFTVSNENIIRIDFQLSAHSVDLAEVKVVANNPQGQQLISALDIKLQPINSSQDVLRIIPGLVIGQHAGGGKAEQIFLRGFDLDHGTDINLSVDGMPINMVSHAHGQGYADAHFIIPEFIAGVDFEKGPYEADKGNFTTAGWANYRLKSTLDNNFIKTEIGQFNTFRLVGGVKILNQGTQQNAYLGGEYMFSDSYFDNPQDFKRFNLMGKFHGHISDKTTYSLTASTFWSKWNASGQIPDRAVADGQIGFFGAIDPNEGGETSRTNFNAIATTVNRKNQIWLNQLYYSNYNFSLFSNFTFFLNDPINGDQIHQAERRNILGYHSNYSFYHELGEKSATLNIGADFRKDFTYNTTLAHTKNRTEVLENYKLGNINETNIGFYADENIIFSPKFNIKVGLRYDQFYNRYLDKLEGNKKSKASAAILSPKLNLYYTLNPKTQFYLNLGKGFHSNDTRAVVAKNGLEVLPAAYGADLGTVFKPINRLIVNAAIWYLWLAQEFVYVGDEGVIEPSGKTKRQGVDLSARYQIYRNIFLDFNANWAKPREIGLPDGENYLPLAVKFTSIGGITLKNNNGFSGSLRYRKVSDRPANSDNSIVAKGYFVTDLLVNYTHKNLSYGLTIQNVLNKKWKETQFATLTRLKNESAPVEEICFTPGTPFNAKISVMLNF